ncbi:MAG: hypothetical protein KIS87_12810 [Phycisphaeraceae bacterium]|nr:hypothetical protein [Phycisphaeraceae bacterium]
MNVNRHPIGAATEPLVQDVRRVHMNYRPYTILWAADRSVLTQRWRLDFALPITQEGDGCYSMRDRGCLGMWAAITGALPFGIVIIGSFAGAVYVWLGTTAPSRAWEVFGLGAVAFILWCVIALNGLRLMKKGVRMITIDERAGTVMVRGGGREWTDGLGAVRVSIHEMRTREHAHLAPFALVRCYVVVCFGNGWAVMLAAQKNLRDAEEYIAALPSSLLEQSAGFMEHQAMIVKTFGRVLAYSDAKY